MPFLIADAERYSLRAGRNVLGGQDARAVPLTRLAGLEPAAVITVGPDGTATIERLSAAIVVTVDGETLGSAPHALAHGARLAIGPCRIMYVAPSRDRTGSSDDPTELAPAMPDTDATQIPAAVTARPLALLEITSGALAGTLVRIERPVCAIGRAPRNDLRLADHTVSASHATLMLKRGTWYVVDLQSANGTYVDGYRVATERVMPDGGTLRVGDVAMRIRVLSGAPKRHHPTQLAGGFWRRLSKRWGI